MRVQSKHLYINGIYGIYESIVKAFMKAVRIGMGRSEVGNKTSNFPANQIVTNS
jgi:hypothetical protein